MNGIKWSKVKPINTDNIFIVCTGPSLQNFDFSLLQNKGYIIAVNDAAKFIPFADAWFTLDPWGLTTNQIDSSFTGLKYAAVPEDYGTIKANALSHRVMANPSINYLHRIGYHTNDAQHDPIELLDWGLNDDKSCINTGNSGFGALNLAYHMAPKHIFLFGIDGSSGYFFNATKRTRSLQHLPSLFQSALKQLTHKNIKIINASENSSITCFPRYSLQSTIDIINYAE